MSLSHALGHQSITRTKIFYPTPARTALRGPAPGHQIQVRAIREG